MSNIRAAYRYALALLSVAEESKQLDVVSKDFDTLDTLLRDSRDFYLFLKSPVINHEKKKVVLQEMFQGKVNQLTSLFLQLMTSKGRENILPEIIAQFRELRDKRLGIIHADVHAAVPLTNEQQQALIEQLNKRTGKNVRLHIKQDPSVIGGFTVQYEDTVLDGSVRRQLEVLSERFATGIV